MLEEPFRNAHGTRHTGLMQLDTSAFKLSFRLYEVAGIGPQTGMIGSDNHIAGLAGKTGQPLYLFPPRSRIFA